MITRLQVDFRETRDVLEQVFALSALLAVLGTAPVVLAQQPPPPPAPIPAVLQNYKPVTAERLKNPEDANWPMIRRTYNGWGYSPLSEITPANVSKMKLVWGFSTGEVRVHEAPALVNNGAMFISTPNNQVIALDAKTGTVLWRYHRPRPTGSNVPHDNQPGRRQLYGDKVYFAHAGEAGAGRARRQDWHRSLDNQRCGQQVCVLHLARSADRRWQGHGNRRVPEASTASGDSSPDSIPTPVKNSGSTYTIPAPGEPGSETWPKGGDQWKTGGGSVSGHRQLRYGHQHCLLGHRQSRSLDG